MRISINMINLKRDCLSLPSFKSTLLTFSFKYLFFKKTKFKFRTLYRKFIRKIINDVSFRTKSFSFVRGLTFKMRNINIPQLNILLNSFVISSCWNYVHSLQNLGNRYRFPNYIFELCFIVFPSIGHFKNKRCRDLTATA